MSSGLATRTPAPLPSHTPGSARFATLVGRPRAPQRQAPGCESNLIATVAHELRNPLTSLRLSLDMLVSEFDELDPQHALRLLKRAQLSANYLQGLTENLSSSAAIAAGNLQSQRRPINLQPCIDQAVSLVHGLLEQKGQTIRALIDSASTSVIADPSRVTQIVANLLANASRYSVDRDEIEIHLSSLGSYVRLRVTDHGPGISPCDQERIFGAWVRTDDAQPGGLGLGLSIVQNLVEQQGGRVGVESALGHGASFWFTLPRATCQP